MRLQTLFAVTNPSLAVITDGADHAKAGGEDARVTHHTVARLQHAFDLEGNSRGQIIVETWNLDPNAKERTLPH